MGRVTATVLFTDLVGSTELRGRLGEEAADALRRRHDLLLAQAVEANNGRVVKGLGDGIMATFSGASDAVAAAVAIQQGIDRLNRSGKAPVPLSVRVGLSAGDVAFEDGDLHGTPVIEASRLCGAAGGGEILASEVVRWLGGGKGALSLTPVGSMELKGLAAPVPVVRVEWEPDRASSVPMPPLLTDVGRIFVGRDAELERLGQLWKAAAAGERRVALLAGEPGVGKTRLAAEMAIRAHGEGGLVLAGRCDEDLGVPYQPFVEALRHFIDHTPNEQLQVWVGRCGMDLARLVPQLEERLGGVPKPAGADPETERYRLFQAVVSWLASASTDAPVLLLIDDLQWAAKPTLLLLRHLAFSVEIGRVLTIATYRDTDLAQNDPLVGLLADLRRDSAVERISLTGLQAENVASFIESLIGHPIDDTELMLARAIHEETEGNPFFVREVLRHLAETGPLDRQARRWTSGLALDELGIPESVREVVGRRLSRLSPQARQALKVAAVVGTEFDLAVVRAAGRLDEETILSSMDEAVEARLVLETDSAERFRFSHALVRDALYRDLTSARRLTLHRHVAEAIERLRSSELDDYLPALAHHWSRACAPAAETAKAVEYALRAAQRAVVQLAHDEAVVYYRQALELLDLSPGAPGADRTDLLISLGEAQRLAGDPEHRETLLEAARQAKGEADAGRLIRAALANSRGLMTSVIGCVDPDRVAMLEDAIALSGSASDADQARLLATLAVELAYTDDLDRRMRLSDKALRIARRLDDPATSAYVFAARFYTIGGPEWLAERLADTDELIAAAERAHDPIALTWGYWQRYRARMEIADVAGARADIAAAEPVAADLGQPTLRWYMHIARTALLLVEGDVRGADASARETTRIGVETGQLDAYAGEAFYEFGLWSEQGEPGRALAATSRACQLNPGLSVYQAMAGLLAVAVDQREQAAEHLGHLRAVDTIPRNSFWIPALAWGGALAVQLGDHDVVGQVHRALAPYSDRLAGAAPVWTGSVEHYLGVCAATLERFEEAEEHFAGAQQTHLRVGAPSWLARTHLEWGHMLLTLRGPHTASRARQVLGQALTAACELGLTNVERDARRLLHECP